MALSLVEAVYAKLYFLWHFGILGSSFGGVLMMSVNPSVKFITSKPDFEHLLIFNGWSWMDTTPFARSFTRPNLVCACNERSNGLLPADNWYESNSPFMFPSGSSSEKETDLTPSVLVLPLPRPAKLLQLSPFNGMLYPKRASRASASTAQALLWQVLLQPSSNTAKTWGDLAMSTVSKFM